jgi:phosphoribosylaminoimidazole-succinocarboxamide synthase
VTQQSQDVLLRTDFPELELYASGKVRDVYLADHDALLFVATDRISAFDFVLGSGIPSKGRVLTQLSLFWFDFLKDICPNHLITANVDEYPASLRKYADSLRGRSMLVIKADMVPIECVVRGYLAGSGRKEYQKSGTVCEIQLQAGLRESDKLPAPIFTPSTKAESGHDINISPAEAARVVGHHLALRLEEASLRDPERIDKLAKNMGLVSPQPGQVIRMDTSLPDGGAPVMASVAPISVISAR